MFQIERVGYNFRLTSISIPSRRKMINRNETICYFLGKASLSAPNKKNKISKWQEF